MCKHSMMLSLANIQQIIENTIILALSILKIPLRANLLPTRLALSGIFCIFAAKYSSIMQRELTMEDLFH